MRWMEGGQRIKYLIIATTVATLYGIPVGIGSHLPITEGPRSTLSHLEMRADSPDDRERPRIGRF